MATDYEDFSLLTSVIPMAIVEEKTGSVTIGGTLGQDVRLRFAGAAIPVSVKNPVVYFCFTNPRDIRSLPAPQMLYAGDVLFGSTYMAYAAANNANGYSVEPSVEITDNTITPIAIVTWDSGSGPLTLNNDTFNMKFWIGVTPELIA